MKKITCFIIVILCLFPITAIASDSYDTYEIPELKMTIDVPADWITFTQDIDDDDPNLDFVGMDSDTLRTYYTDNDIYLNALHPEVFGEIVVTMTTYDGSEDIYDFNRLSDDDFLSMTEEMMDELQTEMGDLATYTGYSTYDHPQAKFAVYEFTQGMSGQTVYSKQYYTIINGQAINVTLHSYAGEISADMSQILLNSVDSITFTEVTNKPGIDLSKVLTAALLGAGVGFIIGLIVYFVKKRKTVKDKANSAEALKDQNKEI